MSEIIRTGKHQGQKKRFKIPTEQGLRGALIAMKESTNVTDCIIITANRETGEFKAVGFPEDDHRRSIEVLEKALAAFKTR